MSHDDTANEPSGTPDNHSTVYDTCVAINDVHTPTNQPSITIILEANHGRDALTGRVQLTTLEHVAAVGEHASLLVHLDNAVDADAPDAGIITSRHALVVVSNPMDVHPTDQQCKVVIVDENCEAPVGRLGDITQITRIDQSSEPHGET